MTDERLTECNRLRSEIGELNDDIEDLKRILNGNISCIPVSKWVMEIRPVESFSPIEIHHMGELDAFVKVVLKNTEDKRDKLQKEYDLL